MKDPATTGISYDELEGNGFKLRGGEGDLLPDVGHKVASTLKKRPLSGVLNAAAVRENILSIRKAMEEMGDK